MVRRALLLLGATIALAACSSLIETFTPPATVGGGEAAAQAASGTTVALLAPLTGANAERGPALVQAAQLALAAPGSPHLDVQDTGSTAAGAAAAAQAAIAAHARLIIGPLTGAETAAVAGPARAAGVPVLAFTNDASQAQPGVWVLGITPAQQMRRLVGTLLEHGKSRVAALLPPGQFGAAMGDALRQALAAAGAPPPEIEHPRRHQRRHPAQPARTVPLFRRAAGRSRTRSGRRASKRDAAGRKEAAELAKTPIPPAPFDVLLLADTGERLAWAASFLATTTSRRRRCA